MFYDVSIQSVHVKEELLTDGSLERVFVCVCVSVFAGVCVRERETEQQVTEGLKESMCGTQLYYEIRFLPILKSKKK